MTDECRPPEGTEAGTWHWLEQLGRPCIYHWHGNRWHGWAGYAIDPARAAICGYRYVAPCLTPDEAGRQARELAEARAEHAAEVDDLCMTNNRNVEALLRAQRELARLAAALKPFADEGQKWSGTDLGHDDLKLIVAEDWHVADRVAREAAFTIGDLKRAAIALAKEGRP